MADTESSARPRGRPPLHKNSQPSSVQALDRALSLLDILAASDGLTLTDLSNLAGMAPSTTHRLLSTLQNRGFVSLDPENSLWTVGLTAFQVGNAFTRNRNFVTMGRPIMRELMERTGETVNLGIEDNGQVVFVSQFESPETMRAFFRAGRRGPIHASGIGKAIMSAWPVERAERVLDKTNLQRFTDNTMTQVSELIADLAEVRSRGWSVDNEEHVLGMRCLAAPIFDEYGEAVAGLSISGPTVRLTDRALAQVGPDVKRSADAITVSIGGIVPHS
ncbi:MAG: HTH-type transcriptional regulator BhcR [Pseudomonadota bacterium]